MLDLLGSLYPWTKALHIVALISWMAGLLYLPRLFVYHCAWPAGSETSEQFKVMERRLLRFIMNPAMIATYVFGAALAFTPGIVDWTAGWFHVKLGFVVLLTVAHHVFAARYKEFAADRNIRPARYYRMANEVPTLAMIVIVVMVVVRPF
ncbi:MAG: protoporphyrinogen oxidase HemJ [Alphaproteobacteria bacterium]